MQQEGDVHILTSQHGRKDCREVTQTQASLTAYDNYVQYFCGIQEEHLPHGLLHRVNPQGHGHHQQMLEMIFLLKLS